MCIMFDRDDMGTQVGWYKGFNNSKANGMVPSTHIDVDRLNALVRGGGG